uniref:Protein kinase domain-containing protein n=1 Tax=Oryza brachyantha TaxID=4533 RepID=J3MD48_ORYBR
MEATDRYDEKNIVSRGGHGTVYKGSLKDGQPIAIKRCVSMADEQHKKEFGKEIDVHPLPDQPQEHRQAPRLLPRSGPPMALCFTSSMSTMAPATTSHCVPDP